METEKRFWKFVKKTDDCWIFTGSKKGNGYGGFWDGGRNIAAHRYSYQIHVGQIPNKMLICHKCDNPVCVNPAHLFLGTMSDNIIDCVNKKRHWANKATHCPKGHPYDLNAKYKKCLICRRISSNKWAREHYSSERRRQRWQKEHK